MAECTIDSFPKEVLQHIASYLPSEDLGNFSSVCRRFYQSLNAKLFWQKLMTNENMEMSGIRLELASKVLKEIQSIRVSVEVSNTISMDENVESAREGLGGPPECSEMIPLTCLEKLVYIISRKIRSNWAQDIYEKTLIECENNESLRLGISNDYLVVVAAGMDTRSIPDEEWRMEMKNAEVRAWNIGGAGVEFLNTISVVFEEYSELRDVLISGCIAMLCVTGKDFTRVLAYDLENSLEQLWSIQEDWHWENFRDTLELGFLKLFGSYLYVNEAGIESQFKMYEIRKDSPILLKVFEKPPEILSDEGDWDPISNIDALAVSCKYFVLAASSIDWRVGGIGQCAVYCHNVDQGVKQVFFPDNQALNAVVMDQYNNLENDEDEVISKKCYFPKIVIKDDKIFGILVVHDLDPEGDYMDQKADITMLVGWDVKKDQVIFTKDLRDIIDYNMWGKRFSVSINPQAWKFDRICRLFPGWTINESRVVLFTRLTTRIVDGFVDHVFDKPFLIPDAIPFLDLLGCSDDQEVVKAIHSLVPQFYSFKGEEASIQTDEMEIALTNDTKVIKVKRVDGDEIQEFEIWEFFTNKKKDG